MFFVTPLMRRYYLAWAVPAVVVVYDAMVAEWLARSRWSRGMILSAVALTLGWDAGYCRGRSSPARGDRS